jgi:type I restriction enzyme S subunit
MTGTAGQKRLTRNFVSCFTIAIPDIPEQGNILRSIKDYTCKIDEFINRSSAIIQLLNEYRTRLISDVVAGKANVQNIKVPVPTVENDDLSNIEQEHEGGITDDE